MAVPLSENPIRNIELFNHCCEEHYKRKMKERYKVAGKTVQVADKGLNCARNIYAAVMEARDGYIFSKSIHGKGLSEKEKQWLLLENDTNVYTDYRDKDGKPVIEINQAKIDEDLKYAGYNLLVTSELDMEPLQVYHTYHNLWKIEESFRITKSYLDARPVYVQKKETIYGHFLICYLSLFLLRILEIKCFKNEINTYDLVNFMRDFRVVDKSDGTYINISQNQRVNEKIKKLIGLTNLDALYLTEKEIENIFEFTMLIDD